MARIRSVHPGLTSDEAYMSMSMVAKAAWTPLWMQCDDHGIFEWKPIVLKALIFPADNVDFAEVLNELSDLGCVMRVTIDGKPCGIVRNFSKYQRPKNPSYRYFKDAQFPEEYGNYTGLKGAATPALPQPSPSPTEIPPQMKEEGGKRDDVEETNWAVAKATRPANVKFEEFWREYPKRDGDNPRKPAEKKFGAIVKTGVDPEIIVAGAKAASRAARERQIFGTKFVPQAIKWLNDQRWVDYAAAVVDAANHPDGPQMFEAKFGSEELDAWDAYGRAKTGKSFPRNKSGGWRFPTQWPPGYVPSQPNAQPPPNMQRPQTFN